jgi:phosphopantetheinyl transferase
MPESVRVYFSEDFEAKASAGERALVSKRFVSDSIRQYLKDEGRAVPETALGDLTFTYGPHGKPFLSDPSLRRLYFSLSHSKGTAACAVADREVGCDLERPGARAMDASHFVKIAKRFFAPDEIEMLLTDPAGVFFPLWTKKEAYAKWTGNGFAEGFSSFSVLGLPDRILCENVPLAENVTCAVCCARET